MNKKIFILVLMPLLALAGAAAYAYISAGQGNQPVITNGFLDKTKYVIGDQMTITASVEDGKGIKEVKAEIDNEKGIDTVKLNLIGGDDKKGTWQAAWTVHDVTGKKVYKTKLIATDSKEQSAEFVLYWIDPIPNPGHKASSVGGDTDAERTFDTAGLYTFQGQIKIQGGGPGLNKVLTSDANGLASWKTVWANNSATKVFSETSGYEAGIGMQTYCISKGYARAIVVEYGLDLCLGFDSGCCNNMNSIYTTTRLLLDTNNIVLNAGNNSVGIGNCYMSSHAYDTKHEYFVALCSN